MRSFKLLLDVLMGAVLPIAVLQWLSGPLTPPVAYVVSALIPVGWVIADLIFLTKRFNFITSYTGLSAVVRGALAFWFVDGLLFAIKDTVGIALSALLFGGSAAVGRPLLQYFLIQGLAPPTRADEQELRDLIRQPPIFRRFLTGTVAFAGVNAALAALNFWLNLTIVVAPFGTEAFNQQVAQVNAIMRVVAVPEIALLLAVFAYAALGVYRALPVAPGQSPWESDFWELMRRRAGRLASGGATSSTPD
ncbi:MAG: VC0807 family protein [Chloroflexota bacterium]|nr:hypothetical protein [Dehalococcoidia bacterium]MDW8252828.1 VC0807 family protein [Chloroflexota bacterium]